jgi:hypothetical protein
MEQLMKLLSCAIIVAASVFAGAVHADETKTPNERVAEGFEALAKGDKLQDRIVASTPDDEVIPQPALTPEVQATVEAAAPWVLTEDNCVPFIPPVFAACPHKPVVAQGQ